MPKIKRAADTDISFQVNPWISKKDKRQNTQKEGAALPLVTNVEVIEPGSQTGPRKTAPSEKRSSGLKQAPQERTYIECVPAGVDVIEQYCTILPSTTEPASNSSTCTSSGKGHIIFYPAGHVEGRAIDGNGDGLSFTGEEIASARECTRDTDWQLLKLSIDRPNGSIIMLAEKRGGDAAKIRTLEPHGAEAEEMQELLASCSGSGRFEFDCETLLDGERADAALTTMGEEPACGKDVILNTGTFTWEISTQHQRSLPKPPMPYDSDLDG